MIDFRIARPGAAIVASAALAMGLLAGCGTENSDSPAAAPAPRTITAEPYKLDSSPESALTFFRNTNVFEGTVVSVLPDVRVTDLLDSGQKFEAVYTPVVIRVDSVYRGDLRPGSEVTIRSMGGEADGLRYVIHNAPAKETFRPSAKLVVFGAEIDTVDSEQAPAMTPNFVYRLAGTRFVDATYADGPANGKAPGEVAMADMRTKLQKMPKVPTRG
ncbi:hypothetical protein GA0074692_4080 [Micromonospora pallida]|uniref:Lipoprotein n=1 Tax=Micromonospora pallida TaxID=145854 RepID=A0A1C6T1A4_9ACTN|nr:hypothetical protein [Micromonospora pallida]SCL35392.1 hypothetical protein GA0074692_4080 [Micromonospora pallida]